MRRDADHPSIVILRPYKHNGVNLNPQRISTLCALKMQPQDHTTSNTMSLLISICTTIWYTLLSVELKLEYLCFTNIRIYHMCLQQSYISTLKHISIFHVYISKKHLSIITSFLYFLILMLIFIISIYYKQIPCHKYRIQKNN